MQRSASRECVSDGEQHVGRRTYICIYIYIYVCVCVCVCVCIEEKRWCSDTT